MLHMIKSLTFPWHQNLCSNDLQLWERDISVASTNSFLEGVIVSWRIFQWPKGQMLKHDSFEWWFRNKEKCFPHPEVDVVHMFTPCLRLVSSPFNLGSGGFSVATWPRQCFLHHLPGLAALGISWWLHGAPTGIYGHFWRLHGAIEVESTKKSCWIWTNHDKSEEFGHSSKNPAFLSTFHAWNMWNWIVAEFTR